VTKGLVAAADFALKAAATVLLLSLLGCVVAGVVSRQLGMPLSWTDEAAQYFMVWTAFAGIVLAGQRRSHIRIDVVIDNLPPGPRRAVEVVIQLCVLFFALWLLRYAPALIERNLDVEWISVPLSAALLYVPLPVAAFGIAASAVARIAEAVRGPVAGDPRPEESRL